MDLKLPNEMLEALTEQFSQSITPWNFGESKVNAAEKNYERVMKKEEKEKPKEKRERKKKEENKKNTVKGKGGKAGKNGQPPEKKQKIEKKEEKKKDEKKKKNQRPGKKEKDQKVKVHVVLQVLCHLRVAQTVPVPWKRIQRLTEVMLMKKWKMIDLFEFFAFMLICCFAAFLLSYCFYAMLQLCCCCVDFLFLLKYISLPTLIRVYGLIYID